MSDSWMFWQCRPISFPVPTGLTGPIYCLGDSHVLILSEAMPSMFTSASFASISAYAARSVENNEYIFNRLSPIPQGGYLLCYFGEIDCRHHIPKRAIPFIPTEEVKGHTIKSLTEEVVRRYTLYFLSILQPKYRLIVCSPYITPRDFDLGNPEFIGFPDQGNKTEMVLDTKKLFTKLLKKFCSKSGIAYVPTYEVSKKNNWHNFPTGTYFNDTTHLGPCMIPVIFDAIKNYKWKGFDI